MSSTEPPAMMVDIGGRRLRVRVHGLGPTVVLDAGGPGQGVGTWPTLEGPLADFATVVTYDRAGTGGSDPGPQPRTVARMVDDLHELLLTLSASFDVTLPAVLAGWSYGGLVVELYATLYPDDVAGLVFIDPTPTERQPCLRIGGPWQRSMFALGSTQIVKTRLGEKLARRLVRYGTPDDVEPTLDFLRDRAAVRETRQALAPHARNRREIEAALAARGLPAVPLTVISAGIRPLAPRHVRLGRWMLDSHARLASRSPLGRTLVAERATHQIPAEQPQIIIDAIRAAIGASA